MESTKIYILKKNKSDLSIDELISENTMLKAQVKAQTDRTDFLEDCIAELAIELFK